MFWRILLLVSLLATTSRAHDVGLSSATIEVRTEKIAVKISFAPAELRQLLPADARGPEWTMAGESDVRSRVAPLLNDMSELRIDGKQLPARTAGARMESTEDLACEFEYERPTGESLAFQLRLFDRLARGHRCVVTFIDDRGAVITETLLSEKTPSLAIPLPKSDAPIVSSASKAPAFFGFLKLGVEHIATGYDHLLFLFGLLVVCVRFRSIVAIITCFTLGHSLTLILATLDVVQIPGRVIEPLIAVSIVFVGIENLLRGQEEPRGRWALSFAFGLIHGFGFAGVLRELGIGAGLGVAQPLLAFNLGVELGQIAIAALVLPAIWWLRKNPVFVQRGVPAMSVVVAAAGLYWLAERTVL